MPKTPESRPVNLRADAVLLAVTLVWGSSFVVVRSALDDAPPLALLFFRFLLATAIASLALFGRTPGRALVRDGLVLGLLLAAGMSFQVVGQAETSASKAAFLTGLAVVLTPFAAYLRTRRLPSLENGIGITLASIGFFLLTYPQAGGVLNRGDLAVAACGVVFAFYGVELAERAGTHEALWLTAVQLAVVTVSAGLLSLAAKAPVLARLPLAILESRPIEWPGKFLWSVLYLGSFCTVGAFLGWTWAQGRMSAIHGAIILALEPVAAALLAAWILRERLGARGIGGGVMVLAGIAVSEMRLRRVVSS
ncbi:MAG: DMT family transporter [Thermoanaerobaculia bacterium]